MKKRSEADIIRFYGAVCNCSPNNYCIMCTESEIDIQSLSEKGLKFDTGKLQYSLIPTETTKALAEVLTFGARKYAPNNWMLVENGKTRYLDALYRHLEAFRSGETLDPESSLHHLAHALTNLAFLHYLETTKKEK